MEHTLQYQWFNLFKEKISKKFNQDITKIENYQPDIAPIVYCCLQHKRIPTKRRTIVLGKHFQESNWIANSAWLALKEQIEKGIDINGYMSKSINDWKSIDYLLYSCNITHFHLYKNKDGGIGKELVFGVFKDDLFYALCIGDHNDIYKTDELLLIADSSWTEDDIFKYKEESEKSVKINAKDFKSFANNKNLQINLIAPSTFTDQNDVVKSLDHHQNTAIIQLELNGINYGKIPFRVYCAYHNEIEFLSNLDAELYRMHKARSMSLTIDELGKKYLIEIHLQRQIKKQYKIPKKIITCSLYDDYR